ncbi:hypothetical protein [Methylocystis sp.]|uniref:hypothetical protein n=1 Tax=Methylocystis sp. TaxID=1911079 RepID=UPI003DA637C5
MSRVRQRLFPPRSAGSSAAPRLDIAHRAANLPVPVRAGFQAGIAEFLLVTRLRARRRAESSADVLERAARIVFVTCKNWFAAADSGPGHGAGHHRTRI